MTEILFMNKLKKNYATMHSMGLTYTKSKKVLTIRPTPGLILLFTYPLEIVSHQQLDLETVLYTNGL
jgi:hypothetical protein